MHADDSTKDARREASAVGDASPQCVIRIKGHLDARWAIWFDGMSLTNESDGTTTIHGPPSTKPRCMACSGSCTTWGCPCSR
jgi:hypothetical protein